MPSRIGDVTQVRSAKVRTRVGHPGDNSISQQPRLIGLDLLRLLAVVLVLGRHMPAAPESWPAARTMPLQLWNQGGWVGVDLFFVLSGFLVSGLLFTEFKSRGHLGIGRFYMRRGWKIYPPFFALIATTVVVDLITRRPIPAAALASEVFFFQSYVPGLWHHTWSLAVEEHFYIMLPLTLAVILRWNGGSSTPLRPILLVAAAAVAASPAARLINASLRPSYDNHTHLFASHLRLDALLLGVAISYGYHFHSSGFARMLTRWRKILILAGVVLLLPAFVLPLETTPYVHTLGLSVFAIASGMLLVGVLLLDIPRRPAVTLPATLGAFSYSVYLWHKPVLVWGPRIIEDVFGAQMNYVGQLVLYFGGSFAVGIVMARLVEVPALRLRDRWFPSRSPGAIEATPRHTPLGAAEREQKSLAISSGVE